MTAWDFKNPDYNAALMRRMKNLEELRKHPERLPALKAYYRTHPADFINDWGMTYDPRNVEVGRPALIPFILFPKQREWVDFVMRKWKERRPGLNEKSRECGVTWLAVTLSCTLCIFYEGVSIGFGSRKTEYVDKIGTMKPILPKGRLFMENLPEEFRAGYDNWSSPYMRISFPETGSLIAGEGGDDIGRGDRAQPLDAKILTPFGWTTMGEILVGDEVIGRDGAPTKVTGVFDRGTRQLFKVIFSDGSSTECCDEHLWHVTTSAHRKTKRAAKPRARRFDVMQLSEIRRSLTKPRKDGGTERRYQIPVLSAPAQFAGTTLPLDPYVVGALLGDGSVGHIDKIAVGFTTADAEMIEILSARLPANTTVRRASKYGYRIVDTRGRRGRGHTSDIKTAVHRTGIAMMTTNNKSIPDAYKFSSPGERLEVLRGLLDTDGWIHWRGRTTPKIGFSSTSRALLDDVKFIVQSLGGLAFETSIHHPAGRMMPGGKPAMKATIAWELSIQLPTGMNPFRLSRKASKVRDRVKYHPSRSIVSVEPTRMAQTRCIRVAAPDHLYVTDDCIVTHNTSIYFFDEEAHHPRQETVAASLSQTTNCQIGMSSVRGMNNLFAQKRWGGKIEVFIFDWHDDPRKDQAWYEKQCEDLDPVVVAQEIDRDYSASVRGIVIPGEWVRSALDAREFLGIKLAGKKGLSFDVADEGADKNAIGKFHGVEVLETEEWSGQGSDIFASTEYVFDVADEFGVREFSYDADGLGADVRGDARIINERRVQSNQRPVKAVGYRGSEAVHDPDGIVEGTIGKEGDKGRTNFDYFANSKAQGWWNLRKKFQRTHRWVQYVKTNGEKGTPCGIDEIISLSTKNENCMKLVAELSQVTYKSNDAGRVVIEKKPDGMKSPNMADTVMMHYAPKEPEPIGFTSEMLAQLANAGRLARRQ